MHDKTSLLLKNFEHMIVQVIKEWKNFTSILVLITIFKTLVKITAVKKPEDTNTFNVLLFDRRSRY